MVLENKSPQEIEKSFNEVKKEISDLVLSQSKIIPSQERFERLDSEFKIVEGEYTSRGNKLNLLFARHNYWWCKCFEVIKDNPSEALIRYMKALSSLIERQKEKTIPDYKLGNMINTYHVPLIQIGEIKGRINGTLVQGEFEKLALEFQEDSVSEKFGGLLSSLAKILVKKIYHDWISGMKLTPENMEEFNTKTMALMNLISLFEANKFKNESIMSQCYEIMYRASKKKLHYLLSVNFVNSDAAVREENHVIKNLCKDLKEFSKKSYEYYNKKLKSAPETYINKDSTKLILTRKSIDILSAKYYFAAYSQKDILGAWRVIDVIRAFLVQKFFSERVPIPPSILEYFSEELTLIETFTKCKLLSKEISKRKGSLSQPWQISVFNSIEKHLEEADQLFKYEFNSEKDYELKMISSTFSGGFSEFFIYELFLEYSDHGALDNSTPAGLRSLMEEIKSAPKRGIRLNDQIQRDKPDIDIHIKGQSAVFIKNARLSNGNNIRSMKRELGLCGQEKIYRVHLLINFNKNILEIQKIRDITDSFKVDYPNLKIEVHDIKELVSSFLSELKRQGRSKINFPESDIHKVLNY